MQTAIAVVERENTTGDGERRQGPLRCTPASVRMRSGGDAGGGGSEEATERDRGENAPRVGVHEVGSGAPPAPPPPPGPGPLRRLPSPAQAPRAAPWAPRTPAPGSARAARSCPTAQAPSRSHAEHEPPTVLRDLRDMKSFPCPLGRARQQVQCALPRTAVSHGGSSEGQISSAFFHRSPPA